jgi:hypothetical protein
MAKPTQPQAKKQETFIQKRNRQYKERNGSQNIGPMQTMGAMAGTGIGNYFGNPQLGFLAGNVIGHGVGWITGTGDYKTNFRSISSNACTVPSFRNSDSTVITHREYIQDIFSGTGTPSAFSTTVLPLNPGQTSTFPWLAQIAANYEEYDIQGMVFEFNSTSGNSVASTNTALGTVIMATEYDPTKPVFESKLAMDNYSFAVSIKPSESFLHAVECKKNRTPVKQLYVRTGSNTGTDLRWTDFGNFTIATYGCPAAGTNLGELWVTYKVKLIKPRLPITIGFGGQVASSYSQWAPTSSNLFATFSNQSGPLVVTSPSVNAISWIGIPGQSYLVAIAVPSTTSIQVVSVAGLASNTGYTSKYLSAAGNYSHNEATGPTGIATIIVNCTAQLPGQTMGMSFTTALIVGAATTYLTVTEIDSTIA